MNCKECEQALTGRQREFCSDKCRMRQTRTKTTPEVDSGSTKANRVAVEPEQVKPEQRTRTVPIPGDADYSGCCMKLAGVWRVGNIKPDIRGMSTAELVRRLHYITDWHRSPEHQEVQRRRVA